jgi:hypothetical protein
MRTSLALCAAAMALAACGRPHPAAQDKNVTIVVPGANGGQVVVGNQLPANLPSYVKPFPGARVTASTFSPKGGVLAMESDATPDAVMAFYKQDASASGMTVQMDSAAMGGNASSRVVSYVNDTAKTSLTVTISSENGVTKVGLLYGES